MVTKRKSVAQEVMDLGIGGERNVETNVEDDLDEGPRLLDSDWGTSDEEADIGHPEKRRLGLKGDIVMEGVEYSGRKASRADAYGVEDSDGFGMDVKSNLDDPDLEDMDDEDAGGASKETMHLLESHQDDDDDDDDDKEDLDEEYNRLHEEDPCSISKFKLRVHADREKGLAVKRQKTYWERWLGLRIMLQKCFQDINQMGSQDGVLTARSSGIEVANVLQAATEESYTTLKEMLSLQATVMGLGCRSARTNVEAEMNQGGDSSLEDLWHQFDKSYNAFVEFRDISLDRFHRQAMLQSGAVQRSNLKILQQGISAQVTAQLRAPHRLIVRSQIPIHQNGATASGQDEGLQRDPHTYDDAQFYQQLLKEFLESKGLGSVAVDAAVKKQQQRRTSKGHQRCKGRALRYTVHEKLVNFMTPVELEQTAIASQLFQNLFGHVG